MNEKKLRHIGMLTGMFAGISVCIGLGLQFLLRLVMSSGGAVTFSGLSVWDVLRSVLTMAVMGALLGLVVGLLTKPEEPKADASAGAGPKPDVDEAARETLAKLGIPADGSNDPNKS
jgi:hypothetical protein